MKLENNLTESYSVEEHYSVVGKFTIGQVLKCADEWYNYFFIECEGEQPEAIGASPGYLNDQNKQRKIWVLQYNGNNAKFTGE